MHSGSERPLQPAPMSSQLLSLATSQPFQCLPLTDAVRDFIRLHGEREGAVSISGLHTTTALIVNEMEERLLMDLEHWLDQLASTGDWQALKKLRKKPQMKQSRLRDLDGNIVSS